MPSPTPAHPFDPALIHAARDTTRDTAREAARRDDPPIVFGGVLRGDSPFLDVAPLARSDADDDEEDADEGDGRAREPGEDYADADALADGLLYMPLIAVAPESDESDEPDEPPAPAAPFNREAVARACARAARPAERVEASVWSDDGVAEHVCDVSAWLAGATRREVEALAAGGWAGDEAAEVAAALAEDDPEVAEVLRHARRADAGVQVEIDGRAALAWLERHRPAVAAALEDAGDDAADDDESED